MLKTRALSALVMAPPALAAAWFGGVWFALLMAVGGALICWEWQRMTTGSFGLGGVAGAVATAVAAVLAVFFPGLSLILVAAGAIAALLLTPAARAWAVIGPLYGGLPAVALVWLRGEAESGRGVIFWILLLVWATDIGAYAFGRLIGGPLLLPAVSPKKTWAGLVGGMLCAAIAGLAMAGSLSTGVVTLALASAALAVVAQAGDLAESSVKRRFGVKDSSNIIPGHGGVLDRVDGLVTVAVAVALARLGGWF